MNLPKIVWRHSYARYKGGYDTDNFTNDFYDEPNLTPGYENHRSREESNENLIYRFSEIVSAPIVATVSAFLKRKKCKETK